MLTKHAQNESNLPYPYAIKLTYSNVKSKVFLELYPGLPFSGKLRYREVERIEEEGGGEEEERYRERRIQGTAPF
jgi:hypothetical protein